MAEMVERSSSPPTNSIRPPDLSLPAVMIGRRQPHFSLRELEKSALHTSWHGPGVSVYSTGIWYAIYLRDAVSA